MNNTVKLSIITPTYNRAHLISKCFESLQEQTCFDFEWIIIDDGSDDNTDEIVSSFATDYYDICYIKKENGGKHTALNASHEYIHGKYVLILDSDDFLLPTAVQKIIGAWKRFENDDEVGVVALLKGKNEESPMCQVVKENEWKKVDGISCRRIYIYSSDFCEVIRTDLFRKYPFPVYLGEKFIGESALWLRVYQTHRCVYVNQVVYICEYLENGLTNSGRSMRISNPRGGMFTSSLRLNSKNKLKMRIKGGMLYTCYGCFAGLSLNKMLENVNQKFWIRICFPFGYLLFLFWRKKYDKK